MDLVEDKMIIDMRYLIALILAVIAVGLWAFV